MGKSKSKKERSKSHTFDVDEAVEHGVESAILLGNIRFWLDKNKANSANIHDGFYWTYNSAKAFAILMPYIPAPSIARYLRNLINKGVLKKDRFNKMGFDQTNWYTIPAEFAVVGCEVTASHKKTNIQNDKSIYQNDQCTVQNDQCTDQNDQCTDQNDQPIPDSKPDTKPDSKPDEKEKEKESARSLEMSDEVQGCFDWAIADQFWAESITSISKFHQLYSNRKPKGLKSQYERHLADQAEFDQIKQQSNNQQPGQVYEINGTNNQRNRQGQQQNQQRPRNRREHHAYISKISDDLHQEFLAKEAAARAANTGELG